MSYINKNGMPMPAPKAEMVMVHELDRSYGSPYDPDDSLCFPRQRALWCLPFQQILFPA